MDSLTLVKNKSSKLLLDSIILVVFLLVPTIQTVFFTSERTAFHYGIINNIDEVLHIALFFGIILKQLRSTVRKIRMQTVVLIAIAAYLIVLIFLNKLPFSSFIQILIYAKFVIVFYYFNNNSDSYKALLYIRITKILKYFVVLTIFLALLQFSFSTGYNKFMNINTIGERGIGGVFLTSLYPTRSLLADILLLVTLVILVQRVKSDFYRNLIIVLFLIFLTFSRKEIFLAILFIPLLSVKRFSVFLASPRNLILFFILPFVFIIYNNTFSALIAENINNENYVRFLIFNYSWDIFIHYFPFGSGPGTYGSVMSLRYDEVYSMFNVPDAILGYGNKRGPIYDVFLASFLAEFGFIGFIGLVLFFIAMLRNEVNNILNNYIYVTKFVFGIFIMILFLGWFEPILTNLTGTMIFTLLGLVYSKQGKK